MQADVNIRGVLRRARVLSAVHSSGIKYYKYDNQCKNSLSEKAAEDGFNQIQGEFHYLFFPGRETGSIW